jgi:hypothetical protein
MRKSLIAVTMISIVAPVLAASKVADDLQRGESVITATPATGKPLPRTSWDGKPDLTGVWGGPIPAVGSPTAAERESSIAELRRLYQPWALERSNTLAYSEDPRLHCGPYGFPRYIGLVSLAAPRKAFYFLLQIVQAPRQIAVLVEYTYSAFRVIPTDGTPHPATIAPTYLGDSVGRWEGDTLVVDVKGFNGKTWLGGNLGNRPPGDQGGGSITSDALHIVERWRLADADTLEYQATVEDPKVLTGPWTTPKYLISRAAPDANINEALCLEPEDLGVITAAEEQKK